MTGAGYLIKAISRLMYWIAAIALLSIVFLTVTDVVLRRFRMPIDWAYEVIILLGAIAIGFSVPQTTLSKGHVLMEFLIIQLPKTWQTVLAVVTRVLGIALFTIFGWRIFVLGMNLQRSGEVTPVLEMPTYPVAFGVAICCFIVSLVLVFDLLARIKGVEP